MDSVDIADAPDAGSPEPEEPHLPLLDEPAEGVPVLVDSPAALIGVVESLASGEGPVAIDAERAGGYRYTQRAYLLQFRRRGSGTHLVDPLPLADLSGLAHAIGDEEWVIHAASQDLPCLRELGLTPPRLFDTELAGRLMGYPKVSLGALLEHFFGVRLAKEHSAADWSSRPLPEPWLCYAALDVELLLELRDRLEVELEAAGKLEWARQEFQAAAAAGPPAPREEPWRRTSGVHKVRKPRGLAVVRSLWEARDRMAQRRDLAPGRVLSDSAIVSAASALPRTSDALAALPGWGGRGTRRNLSTWWTAVDRALALPDADLPSPARGTGGPPPPRAWPERHPEAAVRLAAAREALSTIADQVAVPVENLLSPESVRRLCWEPPADISLDGTRAFLAESGARPWQLDLTAAPLSEALVSAASRSGTNVT